ncbi:MULTISPECIES: thiamine phosphate synthase [unclassified Archaeoglobus]|jgi:thiamine-phosphate pyrophosphorylase|uniref:thiamine phosphate synthase n=1 Tax=unclassified Archaeoglobus TaxID=2643606 RepID=UPI0025BE0F49|nr:MULTISPECIES: thiamine phosphate synthase [unclassified Archaeoglobus]
MLEKMRVYFITDSRFGKHEELAEKALKGGVRTIQLREKKLPAREVYETAKRLRKLTYDYDALLIINDRVDIAIASYADGVHVGQSDLPAKAIRDFFDGVVGVSAHTVEEARGAEKYADYLGVGPVFRTVTKEDAKTPIGIDGLQEIVSAVRIPVIGIGGINESNAIDVLKCGAAGIAVVSAIAGKKNVVGAARTLVELCDDYYM